MFFKYPRVNPQCDTCQPSSITC